MTDAAEALWLRALRALTARGVLPGSRLSYTPGELARLAADRGEKRLRRLVDAWYYPRSYGRLRGALSDEEAETIVEALEASVGLAAVEQVEASPRIAMPEPEPDPPPRFTSCDLCGTPLPP